MSSDPGYEINMKAYDILFKLETMLRGFIRDILEDHFKDEGGWLKRIPRKIIDKCEKRARKEKESYQDLGSDFLMDYADFRDLKEIILEKENWERGFMTFFRNKQIIAIKLVELEPIRNTIAHNRKISDRELSRLRLFSDDIERCISRAQGSRKGG